MSEYKSMSKKLSNLTKTQVKLLVYLSGQLGMTGFAQGTENANAIAQLKKLGFVKQMGRVGSKTRYQAFSLSVEDRRLLKELDRSFI